MANNILTGIASPATRKTVYAVYSSIGLLLGCVQAATGAIDAGTPNWLKAALSVYAFLGTAVGATAASNVASSPPPRGTGAADSSTG